MTASQLMAADTQGSEPEHVEDRLIVLHSIRLDCAETLQALGVLFRGAL